MYQQYIVKHTAGQHSALAGHNRICSPMHWKEAGIIPLVEALRRFSEQNLDGVGELPLGDS